MLDVAAIPGRARVTTPGWLQRAAGLIVVLAVLAGAAVLWAAASIGDAAQTIGRDAEPSVALALRMTATLADMNSAAIDDSLTDGGAASGTSWQFRRGMMQLSSDLVEAARNITYGEAEAAPLRALQQALFGYQEAVVESRYIGAGDAWITSRRVQWASRVNREFAAPAAQALADANASVLEARWANYQNRWLPGLAAGFFALILLVALLVVIQVWLLRRMRRLINPPLAAATLIGLAAALWFGSDAIAEHALLRAAKEDAYDSLHVLFQAKVAVSGIRGDASLWLLDPTVRAEAQGRIAEAGQVLLGGASADPIQARDLVDGMQSALAMEQRGNAKQALALVPKTGGLLGTELGNITFGVPERDAATAAVERLLAAQEVVRAVEAQALGARAAAIAHWLDGKPGGGVATFAAVQAALDRTIAVNQAEFDRDTTNMLSAAGLMAPVTLGALGLIVLLSVVGLWPRLREYR
jgi:hypothetical protein